MPNTSLGDLITLVFHELAVTFEQTTDRAALLKLRVSDIDLDIPAYLRLQPAESEEPAHLLVGLPSTIETPLAGRVGRVRILIETDISSPSEGQL